MLRRLLIILLCVCFVYQFSGEANAAALIWDAPPVGTFDTGLTPAVPPDINYNIAGVNVNVSFQHTGAGLQSRVDNDTGLTGGSTAANSSSLTLFIQGANNTDTLTTNISFRDANNQPLAVEDVQLIILDVDSSANATTPPGGQGNFNDPNTIDRDWSDQVIATASRFAATVAPTVTPATTPVTGLFGPGGAFPLATPDLYSVAFDLANPNAPRFFGRINNGPDRWTSANNTNNGGVLISLPSATNTSFQYSYGPRNGGNNFQGIGLYTAFFTPVIIGVAKQASRIQANGDGTFTITYRILVRNYGETELRNVRVVENLVPTFGGAGNFTVTGVRRIDTTRAGAPAPNVNAGFNGNGDQEILDGAGTLLGRVLDGNNNELQPGGTVTVEFDVRVDPAVAGLGPFENNVTAIGTSPNGTQVTDESTDGVNPDPGSDRGDSVPGNPASPAQPVSGAPDGSPVERVPTRVTLLNTAVTTPLRVVKRITAVFRGGVELVRFNTFNDQPGTTIDNDLNGAFTANAVANQPAGVFQVPTNVTLQTGDQLEYTIYAWNPNAAQQLDAVSICDEVQAPTTLAAGTSDSTAVGNTNAAPAYPGGNALNVQERAGGAALDASCLSFPGTFPAGGGIAVPAAPGFNLPAGQYATIRFRTTIP